MHTRTLAMGSAVALILGAAFASTASAATSRCYDSFGAPVGPVFELLGAELSLDPMGAGARRRVSRDDAARSRALRISRLLDFRPNTKHRSPRARRLRRRARCNRSRPRPATSVWLGDTARAAQLLTVSYAERGRPTSTVADTGRVIYRVDGVWRVFDVAWEDGQRRQIAVNMRPGGGYFAIESMGGESWSDAASIGR